MSVIAAQPRVIVQPWPGGGYAVYLAGTATPISRHDTEDEARDRAERYQRGLDAERSGSVEPRTRPG